VPRSPKTTGGPPAPQTASAPNGSPKASVRPRTKARKATGPSSTAPATAPQDGDEVDELEGSAAKDGGEDEDHDEGAPASVSGARDSEPVAAPDDDAFAEPRDSDVEVVDADADETQSVPLSRDLARSTSGSMERLDPMAAYLREIQRHPLLTPEETHALASRFIATQDPKLAARLVTANLRLVVKIAYEYRRAYKNIMDLVQEGNIGLMQAVKRYDPYRGVKLSSYAAWWIRAYILRFILNNWRLVKLGTTQAQRKLFFNLRKKRSELQAMGIDPTNEEIAKQLNVPVGDVAEMDVRLAQSEKSLDAPVGDSDGRSIAKVDMMPSVGAGPETQMADNELQALVKDKLAEFRGTLVGKEKDLAIFDLRLVADDPLTLQDLGDKFGISRERVRQLEQRLLGRLRDYLKREMGDATDSL
jgi:RNA polymerase sigma-32 factor